MKRIFLLAGLVALVLVATPNAAGAASSETYRQLNLFGDVFERVRSDYVEEVSDKELIESAINGMLVSLDPHSSYLDRDSFADMQVQTKGEFGGLGIEVTMENQLVKVVSPIDDTPAARAGLQANDLISHLDGVPIKGLSLSEAVHRMRGPVHSRIVLTLLREGHEAFDVSIVRDIIRIRPVRSERAGDIAYIRVTTFNEHTEQALDRAMEALSEEIGPRMIGVVLDLRNNPGGLLDQSVAVADAFLNSGDIVSTRGRKGQRTQKFNARRGDIANGLPMVVMINGGSASASEIVAGALQDHRRAAVVGTRSFGKGSVQTIFPLSNQRAIRLTTSRYYTPAGRSIQAKGIDPDIEVVRSGKQAEQESKRRREADLPGALDTKRQGTAGSGPSDDDSKGPPRSGPAEDSDDDFQLRWAYNFLRATAPHHIDLGDATYVATEPIDVYGAPISGATPVERMLRGSTINVIGRVRGRDWLLVDRGDTNIAYVRAAHLAPIARAE